MTAKNPLVSIVCTNYNKGVWIRDAIESFLRQNTSFEYEILLIDDKSTDKSPEIIAEYEGKYPDKIRAFYNNKNLGITKTWIKICLEARGKYIARCDGDDYWINDNKLQKQVDSLENSKNSLWCSTDYDIITPEGKVIHRSAFETGLVDRANSYAEMLATKGFTMASTWLVGADLMRKINAEIDSSAVDDTFNIQLDLFNRTKLTYLPEVTVVYRINEGSDSRPIEMSKITSRSQRLLKTQLEYIKKYKDIDYEEIIELVLSRDMRNELLAIERLQLIHDQRRHIAEQESRIFGLEKSINAVTSSISYRVSSKLAKIAHRLMSLPSKVLRKLLWLNGRRRYAKFYEKNRRTTSQLAREASTASEFPYQPLISVIVPTYNTNPVFFKEMIVSVKSQTYTNWELIIIDDASTDTAVQKRIEEVAQDDLRIKYKFLETNQHIAGATNEGLRMAAGEYVSLLDHDDIIDPSALFEVVKVLNASKNVDFIYTDEDKINEHRKHVNPFLKPDWNQELLYSINYITHFTTIRRAILEKIGGERGEYNGAQDWDLFLRATYATEPENIYHIPKVLYSWRVHDASTAKNLDSKPYVLESQKKLLEDNMRARGYNDEQFQIRGNKYMNGAWDVTHKGQSTDNLHKSGDPISFDRIDGIALSREKIPKSFIRGSHTEFVYKWCQYTMANEYKIGEERA